LTQKFAIYESHFGASLFCANTRQLLDERYQQHKMPLNDAVIDQLNGGQRQRENLPTNVHQKVVDQYEDQYDDLVSVQHTSGP